MSDLPPGFVLDGPQAGGDLPPGFVVDQPSALQRAGRYGRGLLDRAVNTMTFGFGDEIGAGADALTQPLTGSVLGGSQAPTLSQRYDENLAAERGRTKQFATENPVAATVADVTGGIMGAANLPKSLYSGGGLLYNTAKQALVGAGIGGLTGFGEGEGGFENRVKNAIPGAAVGGVIGGALPGIGAAASYGYEKAAPPVLRKVSELAEKFAPRVSPMPLSAAAPEGGSVIGDSLAASLADNSKILATNIEGDAAVKRLALELSRSGGTKKAGEKLADLGESAFIADTSKGAERLANVGYIMPGEAPDVYKKAFDLRNKGTGTRFEATLPGSPAVADAQKFLEAYKSKTGSELYDPVLRGEAKLNVSPDLAEAMKVPSIRDAVAQIRAEATHNGQTLTEGEVAHLVKQTLNKNTDAAFNAGKAVNKDMVRKAGDRFETALYDANPGIKAADEAYAKIANLSNKKTGDGFLERGQKFMRSGTSQEATDLSPSALAADLPKATPLQRQTFQVGSTDTLRNAAQSGPRSTRQLAEKFNDNDFMRQKLDQIYGPAKAEEMTKRLTTEKKFAETANKVMGGSDTAQRGVSLADEFALGGVPTSPMGIVKMLADQYQKLRAPSEAVRTRLAEMLANPNSASNAETLALVEAMLKQQAAGRSYSSGLAGGAGGSFASSP